VPRIKILVLTSSFPCRKDDWYGKFVLNTYKNLSKEKYEITVLAPHAPLSKRKEEMEGLKIIRFPYFYPYSLQLLTGGSGILYGAKSLLGKLQIFIFLLMQFFSFFLLLKRNKFDIIHAHWLLPQGFLAVLGKMVFKIPVVVTVHGTDIFALNRLNKIKAFVLKNCDICTVNSEETKKKALMISSEVNLALIPMGVDLSVFSPQKKDAKWRRQFNDNHQILLGVGRLIEFKGFEYLIKALPIILRVFPKVKLAIVGSGPDEKRLKKIARQLKLANMHSVFLGNLNHQELSRIYASSDVLIVPSYTIEKSGEKEAQGLVVIEGLASGVSVVGSDSGGIRYIIDGKTTGLLAREKDYQDIAEKVIHLLSHPGRRRVMAKNGLKLVKRKYRWEIISDQFDQLYTKLAFCKK